MCNILKLLTYELLNQNYTNFAITITIHLKYQDIQNQVGLDVF
jgi:regulation of enolase protein 1 (concanavalin A-like superfamily)